MLTLYTIRAKFAQTVRNFQSVQRIVNRLLEYLFCLHSSRDRSGCDIVSVNGQSDLFGQKRRTSSDAELAGEN